MCAIAVNALYTTWRKRGTTRQLAFVIVSCVFSALLLLPAIIWYNARLSASPSSIGVIEAAIALIYVALWGCIVPVGATASYCLYTRPRESHTSARMPRHRSKRTTKGNASAIASARPPRRQPGMPAPFVYSDDVPWGWLEHRAGRFQGLRLALKRAVISIGREEDNEIWLDDETSSRYHAEIAWQDKRGNLGIRFVKLAPQQQRTFLAAPPCRELVERRHRSVTVRGDVGEDCVEGGAQTLAFVISGDDDGVHTGNHG